MTATVSFEARKTALVNLKSTFGKQGASKPAILQGFIRLYKGIIANWAF
jgi:hypothetical protein